MKTVYKIILFTLLNVTLSAHSVATVTGLKGRAFIYTKSIEKDAKLGEKLLNKDRVTTAINSKLQMIFSDETVVTLGQNSNFSIEKYLYEETQEPAVKFGLFKGAMRTITGKIGKIAPKKFIVKTKTATIGIRGTNFSVIVGEDGSFAAYCTYGAISVKSNREEFIVKQNHSIHVSVDNKIKVKEFSPKDLKKMKQHYFTSTKIENNKILKPIIKTEASKIVSKLVNKTEAKKIVKLVSVVDGANEGQLDITVDDKSNVIVQNLTETNAKNVQNDNMASLSDLLAGYSMSDALYTGTYKVINITGYTGLPESGDATLSIDFGADSATLVLNPKNEQTNATFNQHPSFEANSFSIGQDPHSGNSAAIMGRASGVFQEPTGNQVKGAFIYNQNCYDSSSGTYDVSTSQKLH